MGSSELVIVLVAMVRSTVPVLVTGSSELVIVLIVMVRSTVSVLVMVLSW